MTKLTNLNETNLKIGALKLCGAEGSCLFSNTLGTTQIDGDACPDPRSYVTCFCMFYWKCNLSKKQFMSLEAEYVALVESLTL